MKRFLMPSLVVFMLALLSACTPAGAELGLVGKWKLKKLNGEAPPFDIVMEIKIDDSVVFTTKVAGVSVVFEGKITKADSIAKTVTIELDTDLLNYGDYHYELTLTELVLENYLEKLKFRKL